LGERKEQVFENRRRDVKRQRLAYPAGPPGNSGLCSGNDHDPVLPAE